MNRYSIIHKIIFAFLFFALGFNNLFAQNRYKKTSYKYDLISGKVNEVIYQKDHPDAYTQKYEYDADNRITEVHTSTDGVIWDKDAGYSYYQHGPLARVELGDNKVQGIDYAYTLQGWIKGVNSNALDPTKDIGKDGLSILTVGAGGAQVARDVFGFSLGYYDGDYSPIGGNSDFLASTTTLDAPLSSLYNGNIRHMVTSIRQINGSLLPVQGNTYRYDQLNRLKAATTFTLTGTTWSPTNGAYKENFDYDANGNISILKRNGNTSPLVMDDLSYTYASVDGKKINNRLLHVNDGVTNTLAYANDIDDQGAFSAKDKSTWNYQYDEIGNLISDKQEEIEKIEWNVSGKIKSIHRTSASTKPDLEFQYDAMGHRIAKIVKPAGQLNNSAAWTTTYYILDAQGITIAVYEKTNKPVNSIPTDVLMLKEQYMYGSKRLGSITRNLDVTNPVAPLPISTFAHTLGKKNYELTNHLGNVLATISDNRTQKDDNNDGTIDYYLAKTTSATDYYAFGSPMPGRDFTSDNYRFGFNGKEKDNEIEGSGNSYDFGARIYSPRLGKFFRVDNYSSKYPDLTPYQFGANCPIKIVDRNGDELKIVGGAAEQKLFKSFIQKELGSSIQVGIDKSGTLTLVGDHKQLEGRSRRYYDHLNEMVDSKKTAVFDLIPLTDKEGRKTSIFGGYPAADRTNEDKYENRGNGLLYIPKEPGHQKIDVADLEAIQGRDKLATPGILLIHELVEGYLHQTERQTYHSNAHGKALDVQSEILNVKYFQINHKINLDDPRSKQFASGPVTISYLLPGQKKFSQLKIEIKAGDVKPVEVKKGKR